MSLRAFLPATLLLAVAGAGGCAARPAAVALYGDVADISAMSGEWRGIYEGPESGRAGSIVFRIQAARDSAYGDVLMTPRPAAEPRFPAALTGTPASPELLRISFVRIADGRVRGELGGYFDPECGCRLATAFEGTVRGSVIEGAFTTRNLDSGATQSGRWRVVRQETPQRPHH
jgi:hypothetical protein